MECHSRIVQLLNLELHYFTTVCRFPFPGTMLPQAHTLNINTKKKVAQLCFEGEFVNNFCLLNSVIYVTFLHKTKMASHSYVQKPSFCNLTILISFERLVRTKNWPSSIIQYIGSRAQIACCHCCPNIIRWCMCIFDRSSWRNHCIPCIVGVLLSDNVAFSLCFPCTLELPCRVWGGPLDWGQNIWFDSYVHKMRQISAIFHTSFWRLVISQEQALCLTLAPSPHWRSWTSTLWVAAVGGNRQHFASGCSR